MKEIILTGRVWKFGDNVSTDIIYPSKYFPFDLSDPYKIATHVMAGEDIHFSEKITKGDFIVAGRNFGCGSSREQATIALKYAGVGVVIAESFARIFFRNAINVGLPVIRCEGISSEVTTGDRIKVNLSTGEIKILRTGKVLMGEGLPAFLLDIMKNGGLVGHTKKISGKTALTNTGGEREFKLK